MWISKEKYEELVKQVEVLEHENKKYEQMLHHIEDCRHNNDKIVFDNNVVIISESAFVSIVNERDEYKHKYNEILAKGIDVIVDKFNSVSTGFPVFADELTLILK